MSEFIKDLKRTHYAGELRGRHCGEQVVVMGWVGALRDHGGCVFVDLRDRSGFVQVRIDPQVSSPEVMAAAGELRLEDVVAVAGPVVSRGSNINPHIPTGEVEVQAYRLQRLSAAATPPFRVADEVDATESKRLKYRYLDLRRPRLQENLILRHRVNQVVRSSLSEQGFLELETPMLTRSTPEGARDYLVPSRVHAGAFYALPQSPQLFKQLFMIAGFDRYFQICRCFRDEDLRADRQPEFTQIDLELSFADQEDVFATTEAMMSAIWRELKGHDPDLPFQRMTHAEAMARFGTDKPDLRFGLELVDLDNTLRSCAFRPFSETAAAGGKILGINANGAAASFSRKGLDALQEQAAAFGARGLVVLKVLPDRLRGPLQKHLSESEIASLRAALGLEPGDLALLVADQPRRAREVLGRLRLHLAQHLDLIDTSAERFLWVTDFPLFEWSEEEKRWTSSHHPFTSPHPEDLESLEAEPQHVRSMAYDLVLNGTELGSGSVRIHDSALQARIFGLLGIEAEEAQRRFGFFLEALRYGTPPHAGIALGLDRLIMILCGVASIRDVIAYPKTTRAACMMSEAPATVPRAQIAELHLQLTEPGG